MNTREMNIVARTCSICIVVASVLFTLSVVAAPADSPAEPAGQGSVANSDELTEIVVTGTQIRGVQLVGAPIISVDRQEIVDSGLNTTADILHDIPQVTSLGANQSTLGANQNANLNTNRDNAINIRGLGTQATLTLLDGRRTPLGGSTGQLFDPSSIPTIAIQNIDVVADGASAIYGSDAVAGVANIILRKDFEGLEAEAHYGTAADYRATKYDAIFGHKWSTGSVVIAAENSYSSQVTDGERPGFFNCNETALGATLGCTAYGVPAGNIKVPAGAIIPKGTYGLPVSTNGIGITAAQLGSENLFNGADDSSLLPKSGRNSLVYTVQQELNDAINLWSEGYYTQNDIAYDLGQYTGSGTVNASDPGFIPLGPGITSEAVTLGLDPYVGPEYRHGFERAYQVAAGSVINLPKRWQFNVDYEHNYNYDYTHSGIINTNAEATAFACATPTLCFNPFGPAAGNLSAIDSFIGNQFFNYIQKEDLVNGKFDGPVFALPAGDIKLAVGGEVHHDTLSVFSQSNSVAATTAVYHTAANLELARTVSSAFAETVIPIVGENNQLPGVYRFDIDLAGRFDHYSDVGSTHNPKYSVAWKPIADLNLHADYGTSFRAPTLCDTNSGCSAGVLAIPGVYGPGVNVITTLGGNPAVQPETATTWSVGEDFKPAWLKGFDFSLNYYDIAYKNVIGTPAQLNPAALSNPIYASFVIKNPTQAQINAITSQPWFVGGLPFPALQGVVNDIVIGTRSNAGAIKTSGLDISASYNWPTFLGNWTVAADGTYAFDYKFSLVPGASFIERLNQANYPVKLRSRVKLGWNYQGLSLITYANYTAGENVVGLAYATQNTPVASYTTIDATLLYKLGKLNFAGGFADNITFSIAVQNLTDKQPPFALITNGQEFDSQQASALGRLITAGIRKSF